MGERFRGEKIRGGDFKEDNTRNRYSSESTVDEEQ